MLSCVWAVLSRAQWVDGGGDRGARRKGRKGDWSMLSYIDEGCAHVVFFLWVGVVTVGFLDAG